jgi:uncharacterized membrane protein YeiH
VGGWACRAQPTRPYPAAVDSSTALFVADLVGVAVFAASGASAAVAKRLDVFGVVFVGCVAALGGGILRDLVINGFDGVEHDVPALAFDDWRYSVTAALSALLTFFLHPQLARVRRVVMLLDAAGLGLFTATGTVKALEFHVPVVGACILGMITGIGGGVLRDLLTAEIPLVLRREIYAVAALAGAVAIAVAHRLGVPGGPALIGAAVLTCLIRLVAIRRNWSAPTPRLP